MLSSVLSDFLTGTQTNAYDNTRPKAFLNWMVVDEEFKAVTSTNHMGAYQVPAVSGAMLKQPLIGPQNMVVRRNGYLYVYLSNESNQFVYFDDLVINHKRGPLTEQKDYYAFGLEIPGLSTQAFKPNYSANKYKYNKQLLDDDLGLDWYQYRYRNYDPQIRRFVETDPLAEKYPYNATYAFAENKLGRGVELEGLELLGFTDFFFESNNAIFRSPLIEEAVKTGVETGSKTSKPQGHHLMPRATEDHPLVESAKKGGFEFNGDENKIPLEKFSKESGEGVHGNHPKYNTE